MLRGHYLPESIPGGIPSPVGTYVKFTPAGADLFA
jgi:hypothetical protein